VTLKRPSVESQFQLTAECYRCNLLITLKTRLCLQQLTVTITGEDQNVANCCCQMSYRQVNITPKYPYHKKLQHFVLWWFYVRSGLVDNILKVGQNWSMGRCPIWKMIFVDLQVIFLRFTQVFSYSISHESVTSDVESSLIPYLGLPVPQPLLVLHLSKPLKQVWYWASSVYYSRIVQIPCVCMCV